MSYPCFKKHPHTTAHKRDLCDQRTHDRNGLAKLVAIDFQPPPRVEHRPFPGEKVRRVCPLGRWQTPEEIAALAVFLASDRAASITGQTLNVDGGRVRT